jgi:hypothetical protein
MDPPESDRLSTLPASHGAHKPFIAQN